MYIWNNKILKTSIYILMSKIFYETLSVILQMLPINEIFGLNIFLLSKSSH